MTEVICFLDQHEGSLMVLITAVYVLATILICWANIKSAKAAQVVWYEIYQSWTACGYSCSNQV